MTFKEQSSTCQNQTAPRRLSPWKNTRRKNIPATTTASPSWKKPFSGDDDLFDDDADDSMLAMMSQIDDKVLAAAPASSKAHAQKTGNKIEPTPKKTYAPASTSRFTYKKSGNNPKPAASTASSSSSSSSGGTAFKRFKSADEALSPLAFQARRSKDHQRQHFFVSFSQKQNRHKGEKVLKQQE